jgi:hypothetical protein
VCGGLQNVVDLGQTEPSVCSERVLNVTALGSEVSDLRAEEVLQTQEDIRSALPLPAVTAADKVSDVCNIVLITGVQVCTVASAFWQRVVWCDVTSYDFNIHIRGH